MIRDLTDLLVPLVICGVLPIAIVYIINRTKTNHDNLRAQILLKIIEQDKDIDAEKLAEAFSEPEKTGKSARETRNKRLLKGCIGTIGGIATLLTAILAGQAGGVYYKILHILTMISIILLTIGISYLIVCYATRNQIADDNR